MKYTVSVNEKKRTVTVELGGYKGVARCCPTDRFDLTVGVELALERARVAKREAEAPKVSSKSVMELVEALEKALPKGQMVVVGNGDGLTEAQKKWLVALGGGCTCKYHEVDEDDGDYESGYDDGYADGYADAEADYEEATDTETAFVRIHEILKDIGII